jgi:ferritin-like metal-binding protein YciE
METQTTNNQSTAAHSKLKELFVEQLQDIYWAEKKLVKTLPKMAEAATSDKLRQAFNQHLEQTQNHVSRLEQVFSSINENAKSKKCPAMSGIAEEGEDIIDGTDEGSAQRDVGLIIAAQKAEHYEIATYGGLAQLAETMGFTEAKNLLGQTLQEEEQTDRLLSQIAKEGVNYKASQEKI